MRLKFSLAHIFQLGISICVSLTNSNVLNEHTHPIINLLSYKFFPDDTVAKISPTLYEIPTYFKELEFVCNSTYPTEWILSTNPWEDQNLKEIPKVTKRRIGKPFSRGSSTLQFESKILLNFKKPYEIPNITCQGVSPNRNLISVIISQQVSTNKLKLQIINGYSGDEKYKRLRYGRNADCTLTLKIDLKSVIKKYSCKHANGSEVMSRIIQCNNPDECNSVFQIDDKSCRDGSTVVEYCNSPDCISFKPNKQPGVIVCDGGSHEATLARRYYFVSQKKQSGFETLHLDKMDIDGKSQIHIFPNTATVYDGQMVEFGCNGTKSYFTHGFVWAIYKNQTKWEGDIIENALETTDEIDQVYMTVINVTFSLPGNYPTQYLFCFGPVWNSVNWQSEISTIYVKESSSPVIVGDGNISIESDGTKPIKLRCESEARPPSNFTWKHNNLKVCGNESNFRSIMSGENWTEYHILRPQTLLSNETFRCISTNFLGESEKIFTIKLRLQETMYAGSSLTVIASVGVCTVLLTAVILIFVYKIKTKGARDLYDTEIEEFEYGFTNSENGNPLLLPYNDKFEIPPEKLHFDDGLLGSGNFGTVKKGRFGSTVVAIKTVKRTADLLYFKALLSELKIMCHIDHHNHLLNLIGACTKNIRKREVFIVFEFCANGCILKYIRNCRGSFVNYYNPEQMKKVRQSTVHYVNAAGKKISTRDLIRWGAEIANGMEYLSNKHVVHGDLAARNILLTDVLVAKVCDFGLSKELFEYSVYVQKPQSPLPLKWMAVESLRDLEFSIESDIWSFGVTIWEIFSLGESPYPCMQWDFLSWKLLKGGYRMERPDYSSDSIYQIMLLCWDITPKNRPQFRKLKEFFETELRTVMSNNTKRLHYDKLR